VKTNPNKILILRGILEIKQLFLSRSHSSEHAVEDVEVPFARVLCYDARLFQKVLLYVCALDDARFVEGDFDILTEA